MKALHDVDGNLPPFHNPPAIGAIGKRLLVHTNAMTKAGLRLALELDQSKLLARRLLIRLLTPHPSSQLRVDWTARLSWSQLLVCPAISQRLRPTTSCAGPSLTIITSFLSLLPTRSTLLTFPTKYLSTFPLMIPVRAQLLRFPYHSRIFLQIISQLSSLPRSTSQYAPLPSIIV